MPNVMAYSLPYAWITHCLQCGHIIIKREGRGEIKIRVREYLKILLHLTLSSMIECDQIAYEYWRFQLVIPLDMASIAVYLTVKAPIDSLNISTAPLGWTLVMVNGADYRDFSLPGNNLNLELIRRTISPFSKRFITMCLSCHFLVRSW